MSLLQSKALRLIGFAHKWGGTEKRQNMWYYPTMSRNQPPSRRAFLNGLRLAPVMVAAAATPALGQALPGGFAQKNIQDIQRRRDCQENRPNCLPSVRRQLQEERNSQIWMGSMMAAVILLVILIMVRASRQKQEQMRIEGRQRRERLKQRRAAIRASAKDGGGDYRGEVGLPPSLDDPLD